MNEFDQLRNAIKNYKATHGLPPRVRVSMRFWAAHADAMDKLAEEGISIRVVNELTAGSGFLLENRDDEGAEGIQINTPRDLKQLAERWIAEGKGDWPVVFMPDDADVYVPVWMYTIVPGQAPQQDLDLQPDFPGAPEAEHILVVPGG